MEEIKVHFDNYIGTKSVNGFPLTKVKYCKLRGWPVPVNEDPDEEGYLVEYPNSSPNHERFSGYISWSPKLAFEDAYRDITIGCAFGHAVELMKLGFKMARKGWNGKGMYISYVAAGEWATSELEIPFGENLTPRDWLGIKTVDSQFMPWVPSQSDVLAEDWVLL